MPETAEDRAKKRVLRQVAEFIDERKEKAFKSTFEEPTKMYFHSVGDFTMEGDVEVHGSNVYLAVLLSTLSVRLPREAHMSDEAKGICMFMDAKMDGELQELWRPENVGKPFAGIRGRPSPTRVERNFFVFRGATPKAIANAAVDDSPDLAAHRSQLAPYLQQFAAYFKEECLLEPMLNNLMQTQEPDLQVCYAEFRGQADRGELPDDYREFVYDVNDGYVFCQKNASLLLQHIGAIKQEVLDELE
mmetsp:Transcript_112520/g.313030  ORF Transcript_112520/g.313030 Transcript_112520/m.313030 type:complete len:246 (+) Transcript_112520:17-754(+)